MWSYCMSNRLAQYHPAGTVAAYSTGPVEVSASSKSILQAPFFTDKTIYQKPGTTAGNYCNHASGQFTKYDKVGGKKKTRKVNQKKKRVKKNRNPKKKIATRRKIPQSDAESDLIDLIMDLFLITDLN